MSVIRKLLAGVMVAAALAVSIVLIVRNFPGGHQIRPQQEEMVSLPADPSDAQPSPEQNIPASPQAAPAEIQKPEDLSKTPSPEQAVTALPPAVTPPADPAQGPKPVDLLDLKFLPPPGYTGPAQSGPSAQRAADARLTLTAEQSARLRYVLLSHTIMQSEAPEFPLRIGGTVPQNVALMPLPREIADAIPEYKSYSYVISQYQIVIVITDRREIDLLIPTG